MLFGEGLTRGTNGRGCGEGLQPRIIYPARLTFRFGGEIKIFPDKQKLREFSTTQPALQQFLKELL